MTKVNLSATLPVSGHTVWDVIGGFNNLAQWHRAIRLSRDPCRWRATRRVTKPASRT
jgi:hypothetical protein